MGQPVGAQLERRRKNSRFLMKQWNFIDPNKPILHEAQPDFQPF